MNEYIFGKVNLIGLIASIIAFLLFMATGLFILKKTRGENLSPFFSKLSNKKVLNKGIQIICFALAVAVPAIVIFSTLDISTPDTQMKSIIDSKYTVVYPEKITGNLHNPGMGWVGLEEPTYTGHANLGADGDIPMVDNIGLSTSWAHIETAEGVYDWSNVDRTINYWSKLGKFINIRITTDTLVLPYTSMGVPPWLVKKYSIPTKTYKFDGFSPVPTYKAIDVTNVNYLKHLDLFLNELKEHLKGNTLVDTVEILGYGVWGEWHSGISFKNYDDRHKSLANIIDRYVKAFKELNVSMVLCAAWEYRDETEPNVNINQKPKPTYKEFLYWSSFDYAMTLEGVSFRRNGGAGVLKYDYDRRLFSDYIRSNKRQPLMAEYFSGFDDQIAQNPVFNVMEGIDDILFQLRPNNSTILGWANVNVQKVYDLGHGYLYERGNEKFGYRLSIDKARYPDKVKKDTDFTVLTSFSNTSVGRYIYDYPLKYYLLDDTGNVKYSVLDENANLKTLINGELLDVYTTLQIPSELTDGNYKLAVAIVDKTGNPKISLGNAGDVKNDKRYILGDINVSGNNPVIKPLEKVMTYEQLKAFSLKPNTSYSFTFEYTPNFDVKNFKFGNYDGYEVSAITNSGGEGATVGYNKWQDVSQEQSQKTIKFKTQNFGDYKLQISSSNFGEIEIGKCILEESKSITENFEGEMEYFITNDYSNLESEEKFISGKNSMYIDSSEKGHKYGLSTPELKPDTTYTISFKVQTMNEVGNGGYFFLSLDKPSNVNLEKVYDYPTGWKNDIAEWYERMDTPAKTLSYTFRTSEIKGLRLYFGVHNMGAYNIDDILFTQEADGKTLAGKDIPEEKNIVPVLNKGLGDVEDFEKASFFGSASMYDWGFWQTGRMTSKKNEVISGNYSFLGQVEDDVYTIGKNEWLTFANGKAKYLAMSQGNSYRVSFKYRVLEKFPGKGTTGENTFFYLLARPESLGAEYQCDDGFTKFGQDAVIGRIYEKTVDIKLERQDFIDSAGNKIEDTFKDYIIQFGMYMPSKIVIDDIKVVLLGASKNASSPIDFESSSAILEGASIDTTTGSGKIVSSNTISGKYSLLLENKTNEWYEGFTTLLSQRPFKKDTAYTISFDYKVVTPLSADSVGFQAYMKSPKGGLDSVISTKRFGLGEGPGTRGKIVLNFVIDSKNAKQNFDDYAFYIGMNKYGAVMIDNITFASTALPQKFDGKIDFESGNPIVEGYNSVTSFGSSSIIEKGAIAGKKSLYFKSNGFPEYCIAMQTLPNFISFKKNVNYTIKFQYKVVEKCEKGFMAYIREGTGNYINDLGLQRFGANMSAGSSGSVTMNFTVTNNFTDYMLTLGMQGSGAVMIDNIEIRLV